MPVSLEAEVGTTVLDSNMDCPPDSNSRPALEGSEGSAVAVSLVAEVGRTVVYSNPDCPLDSNTRFAWEGSEG